MAFSSSIHKLPRIYGYMSAEEHFNKTPRPRGSEWDEHQRPLRTSRFTHYRLERGRDGDWYDLCLYRTVMARYYKPDANGTQRKLYAGADSQTSDNFMYYVTDYSKSMVTTDGQHVVVPRYVKSFGPLVDGAYFCLDLLVTPSDKLIVAKSAHTPHYKHVMGKDDRQRRAMIRHVFEPLVTLACMRLPEFIDNAQVGGAWGRPFGGMSLNFGQRQAIDQIADAALLGIEMSQEDINDLMDVAQGCVNALASTQLYKQGEYHLLPWLSALLHDSAVDITEKQLRNALHRKIMLACGAVCKSEAVELPQFMNVDAYPRSSATCFR